MGMSALQRSVRVCLLGALGCLLTLTTLVAPADAKKKRASAPTVSSVSPLKVGIGDTLVIRGKNFRAGENKNTIIFRPAAGGASVFAPTLRSTTTRIVLKVPSRLGSMLTVTNGQVQATRFQLRVVAARASTSFTSISKSPLVLPATTGSPNSDCDGDKVTDDKDGDDDNDGLSDAIEAKYGVNTCNKDSDADGVWDSFEFESALDLNSRAVPYPSKKPWPNPLDAVDANDDFDGDGLSMAEEHMFWQAAGRPFPLNYSDGTQYTGGAIPTPVPDTQALDLDQIYSSPGYDPEDGTSNTRTGEGFLSDDEKDFDKDGLNNWSEVEGLATEKYWTEIVNGQFSESPYDLRHFANPDPIVADTDGDGILDGLDDQDNDGWNNMMELHRRGTYPTGYRTYMVNPYNPCLPDYNSRTCSRYFPASPPTPLDLAVLPTAPLGWDPVAKAPINSPTPGYIP